MKVKVIIEACAIVAIALFSAVYICNINTDSKVSNENSANASFSRNNSVSANFSEIILSQDELIEKSDLIVRCVFKGEKVTKDRTRMTKGGDGKEFSITLPVTTYNMKLVESLKGSVKNNFDVVTSGSGNEHLETGDEYVLFLTSNESESTYTLLSYSQGLNILKQKSSASENSINKSDSLENFTFLDEAIEIESAETKEVMDYKNLKEKIKELHK